MGPLPLVPSRQGLISRLGLVVWPDARTSNLTLAGRFSNMIPGQHFDIRSAAVSVSADKILQGFRLLKASSMSATRRLRPNTSSGDSTAAVFALSFLALLSSSLEPPSYLDLLDPLPSLPSHRSLPNHLPVMALFCGGAAVRLF